MLCGSLIFLKTCCPGQGPVSGGVKIIFPRRLDLIKSTNSQLRLFSQGRVPKSTLSHAHTEADLVGNVQDCALRVDQEGYRKDWPLVNVDKEFLGENNQWWDIEALKSILRGTGTDMVTFTADITGPGSLGFGSGKVYKYGATTGWTVGGGCWGKTVLFLKDATISVEKPLEVHSANIIQAKVTTIGQVGKGDFAVPGDSGSCLFNVAEGKLYWVGMIMSVFFPTNRPALALGIPPRVILRQLKGRVGKDWELQLE